jgi:hypothetical protein
MQQGIGREHTEDGEKRPDPVPNKQREKRDAPAGAPDSRGLVEGEAEQDEVEQQRKRAAVRLRDHVGWSRMWTHPSPITASGNLSGWHPYSLNATFGMMTTCEPATQSCVRTNSEPSIIIKVRLRL